MDQIHSEQEHGHENIKVYKRRWIMLLLCFLYCGITDSQTQQYMVVAHIIAEYYNVTYVSVTWTSSIFVISSGCLSALVGYIIRRVNLRNSILLALVLLCLSSWIRLLSVSPERFWIIIFTQVLASLSQAISLVVPVALSSTWFGPKEISFCCSVLTFGSIMSISAMMMLSEKLIHTRSGKSSVEKGLYALASVSIAISTILLILLFFFLKKEPPKPPTLAQSQKIQNHKTLDFKESLKQIVLNSSFWRFLGAYCIYITSSYVIPMFANRNILKLYPDRDFDVGKIVTLTNTMGMIGIIAAGYAIDKLDHFKAIIITLYGCSTLSMFAYTFLLDKSILWAYIVSGIFGFFMLTSNTTRFDMSAELCYPVDESISVSVAIFFTQILVTPSAYGYTALLDSVGIKTANLIICGCLVFGFVLLCSVRFDLRRRKINRGSNQNT